MATSGGIIKGIRSFDCVNWYTIGGRSIQASAGTPTLRGIVFEPFYGNWIVVGDDDGTDAEIYTSQPRSVTG